MGIGRGWLLNDSREKQSVFLILGSTILYVVGDVLIKMWLKNLPAIEVVLFRNLFGLLILLVTTRLADITLVGERFFLLTSRGVLGVLSLTLFYFLIERAPLANAVVFLQSAALFTALFAYIQSHEKLSHFQMVCLVLGFLGVCLIVKPHIGFSVMDLAGVLLAIVSALAMTSIKELNHHYNASSIVCSYFIIGVLFPVVVLLFNHVHGAPLASFLSGTFVAPPWQTWWVLFALAMSTTLGQLYKTRAYALNKAAIISTLSYSRVVFALVFGVLLGDAFPDGQSFVGIVLVTYAAWKIAV